MELLEEDELISSNIAQQYFLFICNKDLYALPILSVREIVEYQDITKIPKLNSFVKGVTNIRGNIVAVIDLLDRFELTKTQIKQRTSFAIVEVSYNNKITDVALMIDEVYEVDSLDENSICDTPLFGTKINTKFIKCVGKYNKQDVSVLDKDEVLNLKELSQIKD